MPAQRLGTRSGVAVRMSLQTSLRGGSSAAREPGPHAVVALLEPGNPVGVREGSQRPSVLLKMGFISESGWGFTATLDGQDRESLCVPAPATASLLSPLHQDAAVSASQGACTDVACRRHPERSPAGPAPGVHSLRRGVCAHCRASPGLVSPPRPR